MSGSVSASMGITGNAVLLLGYIGGTLIQDAYDLVDVDAVAGIQRVRHVRTGNLFQVAVIQLDGTE